ncbi:MAG TPA: aminodeoxychorismate synthase component I [Chitinophagaceae bacterium]|nr:aminodeoxychorismate synthase component I [Chitinophagaceae bacterium]
MNSQQTIIEKINSLAANHKTFLFIADFELKKTIVFEPHEFLQQKVQFEFPKASFKSNEVLANHPKYFSKSPIPFHEYKTSFDKVKQHLNYGNSFLTNLTAPTKIETNLTLSEIYQLAKAKYKISFQDKWICFSPETFIQINQGEISTHPMKGTIDASIPNAEFIILNDPKETAEHYTIVDLMRNDLSKVATQVQVEKFRYIDRIKTNQKELLQVSSKITGKLPPDYLTHLGTILFDLLPAGSISGAPKCKTLDIINEAENYSRGYYTGVAFYFDGHNLDSCVLIRFIEQTPDCLVYKSGGGITVNSQAENEYQELIDKVYVPGI